MHDVLVLNRFTDFCLAQEPLEEARFAQEMRVDDLERDARPLVKAAAASAHWPRWTAPKPPEPNSERTP